LLLLEENYKANTVFISGAAHEYSQLGERNALNFVYKLSRTLASSGARVVSGFGLGVGSSVISGVLEQVYMNPKAKIEDQLVLRPFPQTTEGHVPITTLWTRYREDMIDHAGIALFVFGNKLKDNKVVLSNGMREEFTIAKAKGLCLIPVGATGYMAEEIWQEMNNQIQGDVGSSDNMKSLFAKLGDESTSTDELIDTVVKLIDIRNGE